MHLSAHIIERSRKRFQYLRGASVADLRRILEAVATDGELIPCVCVGHELRRAYLVRVAGGMVEAATLPSKGAAEIIVAVHIESDGEHLITVFNERMDLPEAEPGHPRKYA